MVAHAFNPSTQEEDAAGQPGLRSMFQDSQGYIDPI